MLTYYFTTGFNAAMGPGVVNPALEPYLKDFPLMEFTYGHQSPSTPLVQADFRSVFYLFIFAFVTAVVLIAYLAVNGGYTFYENLFYCVLANNSPISGSCERVMPTVSA